MYVELMHGTVRKFYPLNSDFLYREISTLYADFILRKASHVNYTYLKKLVAEESSSERS